MLLVASNRHNDRLEIEAAGDGYHNHVRLTVGTLHASRDVVDFAWRETVFISLAHWFTELDRQWRGWTDTKRWSSMEGELTLTATHDGLGTVLLTVELHHLQDGWAATGELQLDGGGMSRLARAAVSAAALPD